MPDAEKTNMIFKNISSKCIFISFLINMKINHTILIKFTWITFFPNISDNSCETKLRLSEDDEHGKGYF